MNREVEDLFRLGDTGHATSVHGPSGRGVRRYRWVWTDGCWVGNGSGFSERNRGVGR
jgi:hypothetical protein